MACNKVKWWQVLLAVIGVLLFLVFSYYAATPNSGYYPTMILGAPGGVVY